jgi:hypothetical protein
VIILFSWDIWLVWGGFFPPPKYDVHLYNGYKWKSVFSGKKFAKQIPEKNKMIYLYPNGI